MSPLRVLFILVLAAGISVQGCDGDNGAEDAADVAAEDMASDDGVADIPQEDTVAEDVPAGEIVDVTGEDPAEEEPESLTYSGAIGDIFRTYCLACHSTGTAIPLATYEQVMVRVDSGSLEYTMSGYHYGVPEDVRGSILDWIEAGSPE